MPVIGIRRVTAAMFMSAWITIIEVRPPAMSLPNGSLHSMAMRVPA